MNINALIQGFNSYLKDLELKENKEYVTSANGDVSIFMYSSEFKDYLEQNVDSDKPISSMSITDLLNMDIVNGKLVEKDNETDEEVSEEQETEQTIYETDEVTEEAPEQEEETAVLPEVEEDGTETAEEPVIPEMTEENDETSVADILNNFFEDNSVKSIVDSNGNGKIEEEEISSFLDLIKSYDGNNNDISIDDLLNAAKEIKDGSLGQEKPVEVQEPEKVDETQTSEEIKDDKSKEVQETPAEQPTQNINNGGGGDGASYTPVNNNDNNNSVDLSKMTLDQLKQERTTREGSVKDARQAVNDVLTGKNEKVAAAKGTYDSAKEAYQEALKNDKKVDDKVKEEQAANLASIEETQSKIDELNVSVNDTSSKITDTKTLISADDSNISALQDALVSLNSAQTDDADKKKELETKKAAVEQKIEEAKKQKEEHENTLKDLEQKLTDSKKELDDKKDELKDLENKREEIEKSILENCSDETKDALQTFNTAKRNVETVKNSELNSANSALKDAETKLDEVNKAINEKEATATKRENSFNDMQAAIDWARQYDDYSQGQMKQIFSKLGYRFDQGLWCADFVRMVLGEAIGDNNLPEWYRNVQNKAYCPSIQSAGKGHEISAEDAKAGDIVLYDWDGDGKADHVGLFVDNGNGSSTITAIEGNTSGKGGASCVEELSRNRSSVLGIYSMR